MKTEQEFTDQFHQDGFCIEPNIIPEATVKALKQELSIAIEQEAPLRREGIDDPLQVACCPYYSGIFLDALEPYIFDRVDVLLGQKSIIYSYNNSSMPPGQGNFSSRVHRDSHLDFSQAIQSIGVIILLDEFTPHNGATWYLPKSHLHMEEVSDADFYKHARQLQLPAGSALFFHPHLVHAGGVNKSDTRRDALSLGFCKPNMKQRLNLPCLLKEKIPRIKNKRTLQKIGLNAQPPESIQQFYVKESIWYNED